MRFVSKYSFVMRGQRLVFDIVLAGLAFVTSAIVPLVAQFGTAPLSRSSVMVAYVALYMGAAGIAFVVMGTHRTVWRYVSFHDLLKLAGAVTLTLVIFFTSIWLWEHPVPPISGVLVIWTVILLWAVTLTFVTAPRFIARLEGEHRFINGVHLPHSSKARENVSIFLIGVPDRIDAFIRECTRTSGCKFSVLGAFTEDREMHGSYLNGVKVLGAIEKIPKILRELRRRRIVPNYLVLADDQSGQYNLEQLLEIVAGTDIRVGRVPPLESFQGKISLRPIVLSDLLGRPEITLDKVQVAALIEGRRIMVTGAGGSIGSELCRQISAFKPEKIVLVESCEFNLYSINQELQFAYPMLERVVALADVRDRQLIEQWVKATQPDIVFHAAALKHVPLLEEHPIEAIKTNVFGTINVAEACRSNHVKAMVTISTDKAVNPYNIMGASKRLAEAYCQGLDQAANDGVTRFMTVRFGNVLGSAGSVVPLFQQQIEMGGPITVTHPDIIRYFMTIPEAATLVLQAGAQGVNLDNERGSIYVLDMGHPVKIIDLAKQMIRLAGRRPEVDIKVNIIGLRPGEKLYEEVVHGDEFVNPTSNKSVFRVTSRITDLRILRTQMLELQTACARHDQERVLRLVKLSVPEFGEISDRKVSAENGFAAQ